MTFEKSGEKNILMKKIENNIKLARADVSFWWHGFCVKEGFSAHREQ